MKYAVPTNLNKAIPALIALLLIARPTSAQEKKPEAQPAQPANPAEPVARPAPKLSPKQQVTGFYAMCKQGRGGEGLREMLSSNPVVKGEDVQPVADSFARLISQMGGFVDFNIVKETKISDRVLVVRCVANFERQPFVNEFTFYDPGSGEWRLVHMHYDSNLASMFLKDVRAAAD